MKIIILLLTITTLSNPIFSQNENLWSKNFGGTEFDQINGAKIKSNNNLIVTGYTDSKDFDFEQNQGFSKIFLSEINDEGEVLMTKTYGGSSFDIGWDVIEVPNEGYMIVGETFSSDGDINTTNNSGDGVIIKTDLQGEIIWLKTYGGSNNDFLTNIHASDNGYIITGTSESSDNDLVNTDDANFWVFKIDYDGDVLWSKKYGNSYNGSSDISEITKNGDILLGGLLYNPQSNNTNIYLVRLDNEGNEIWTFEIGGNNGDFIESICEADNGDILISAQSYSDDIDNLDTFGSSDIIVASLTSMGEIKWIKSYGDEGLDLRSRIAATPNGNLYLLFTRGELGINEPGSTDNIGLSNMRLLEINSTGSIINQEEFGGSSQDLVSELIVKDNVLTIIANTVSRDGDIGNNYGSYDGWISQYKIMTSSISENIPSLNVKIFPNPFIDNVTIDSESIILRFELYDSLGKLIQNVNNPNQRQITINTDDLSNGIYHIKCTNTEGITTAKLICGR